MPCWFLNLGIFLSFFPPQNTCHHVHYQISSLFCGNTLSCVQTNSHLKGECVWTCGGLCMCVLMPLTAGGWTPRCAPVLGGGSEAGGTEAGSVVQINELSLTHISCCWANLGTETELGRTHQLYIGPCYRCTLYMTTQLILHLDPFWLVYAFVNSVNSFL